MKTVGLFIAGLMGFGAAANADGLAGLDAHLNGTGRIGVLTPRSENQIAAGASGDIRPRAGQSLTGAPLETLAARPVQTEALGEAELRRTEERVAGCRIEVARRRQVAPTKVAAGSLRLRFVVEPNGRVHDAEAVAEKDTDHEVAACAKRILSDWAFGKHTGTAVVVERNYRFDERAADLTAAPRGPVRP
jgi:hypothetical protein